MLLKNIWNPGVRMNSGVVGKRMADSIVNIPEELMSRIQQAARTERVTPEQLVHEAVEQHLRRQRLESLYARGERRTRELGLPESQVNAIVREERDRVKLGR